MESSRRSASIPDEAWRGVDLVNLSVHQRRADTAAVEEALRAAVGDGSGLEGARDAAASDRAAAEAALAAATADGGALAWDAIAMSNAINATVTEATSSIDAHRRASRE